MYDPEGLVISVGVRVPLVVGMIMTGLGVPDKIGALEIEDLKGENRCVARVHCGGDTFLKDFHLSSLAAADGKPDYDYMETFIRIQQKLVIKNLAEWKDRELAAYRLVAAK